MLVTQKVHDLVSIFEQGGVIAYPTEAVFGLGCNPDNEAAVLRLLEIKKRNVDKGLILIASDFSQVEKYLKPLSEEQVQFTTPSETTYIYPARASAPKWLTGRFDSLAVRITRHPLAKKLCETMNSALVSTSANLSGQAPAVLASEVEQQLNASVDALLDGEVGNLDKPTEIRDSITGDKIR